MELPTVFVECWAFPVFRHEFISKIPRVVRPSFREENNDRIETIFYVIESDYSGRCNHAHLLIKGSDLIVQDMATKSIKPTRYNLETNRNVPNEIQYFEGIKNKARAIEYVTKHIGKGEMFVRSHDIITQEQVVDERIYNWSSAYDTPIAEMHPNYEYHKKHNLFMNLFGKNKLIKYPSS